MQEIIENQTSVWDENEAMFASDESEVEEQACANECTDGDRGGEDKSTVCLEQTDSAKKATEFDESLLSDQAFLEKNVYTNKRICEEIIDRYIVSLKNGTPPRVMGSGGKGIPSAKAPTTLKEAKLLAEIMFSKND